MRKFLKRLYSVGATKRIQDEKSDVVQSVIPIVPSEARDEDKSFPPSRASLEGLPVEIQFHILLSIQDIASLKSLIHASPVYHAAYRGQRQQVLNRILFNSIHPDVLYDALFSINSSRTLTSDLKDRATRVKKFLSEYDDGRGKGPSPEHLDLENASKLAQLHIRVQHATKDLCQTALLSPSFPGTKSEDCGQLSSNECRRFYRALYRFEMYCNLFRNWKNSPDDGDLSDASSASDDSTSELDSAEKSSRFLSLFKPWEVEEIACVRDYFCSYYGRMLLKFEPDLRRRRPNIDLSEDGPWLEENIEYLMSLGLRFYRRMETSPPGRQMRYLFYGLRIGPPFLSEALKLTPEAMFYQPFGVDDPEVIPFEDDCVRDGPNVMWAWITDSEAEAEYFFWANETLREWGYVFWDQKRLREWNVPNEKYDTYFERKREEIRKSLAETS